MVDVSETTDTGRRRDFRLVRSPRLLQIILGLFWLLDAGLQFQPFMFSSNFTTTYLLNNAHNQPDIIRWIITNVGNIVGPHVAVWNTFFAVIQVAIGLGLLFRPTVRPALAVSFFWAFGVWFFGEGLGLIFTGSASALTGAPGSVFLYGLIGLMAWPRSAPTEEGEETEPSVGLASSAAGQGIGGAVTPSLVWCGYWSLAAILFLLPDNRTPTSVSSAITGMSSGEPSAYSHFLNSFGNHFGSGGVWTTWLLAIGSLVVGFGPLVFRRPTPFLAAGGLLATFFWVSGQGLGGIFTGSGTDPNSGPLIVLLALAMVPAELPDPASWLSPFSTALFRYPVLVLGSLAALLAGIFLSAAYPVAAQESTSTAMAGMAGMSGATSGSVGGRRRRPPVREGTTERRGRGWTSRTRPTWSWLGLARDEHERRRRQRRSWAERHQVELALHGPSVAGGGGPTAVGRWRQRDLPTSTWRPEDARRSPRSPNRSMPPSTSNATSEAVARYSTPAAAQAAGYVPVSPTNYPVVYYVNPTIVAANQSAERSLDPSAVDGLVYARHRRASRCSSPPCTCFLTHSLKSAHALRLAGPMAPTHWSLWTETGSPADPLTITGLPPCPAGYHWTHPVHDHGVAGPRRGRATRHPATRHPDCRGGDHADRFLDLDEETKTPLAGLVWARYRDINPLTQPHRSLRRCCELTCSARHSSDQPASKENPARSSVAV